jgi:hypothetical protein
MEDQELVVMTPVLVTPLLLHHHKAITAVLVAVFGFLVVNKIQKVILVVVAVAELDLLVVLVQVFLITLLLVVVVSEQLTRLQDQLRVN